MEQLLLKLFGGSFPLEAIADCRISRVRVKGAGALIMGSEPTSLTLTLADGQKLEASARGPGPERDAIESLSQHIASWKADQALDALANGRPFEFGDVDLAPEGITHRGRMSRWDEITGYAIREGGLVWDDARGALAGDVWLGRTPFSDALCLVIARRLAGRDYDKMAPGTGPKHGFFSVTARTHIFGTNAYTPKVIGVLLAVGLVVGLIYGGWWAVAKIAGSTGDRSPTAWMKFVDEANAALDATAANAPGVPLCARTNPAYADVLISTDKTSIDSADPSGSFRPGSTADMLGKYDLFVWRKEGATVRVIRWQGIQRKIVCQIVKALPAATDPVTVARVAAAGVVDAPAATTATVTPPVVTASATATPGPPTRPGKPGSKRRPKP